MKWKNFEPFKCYYASIRRGALTPSLWGFEERETLMTFYERASGSRLHANYFRIGGVHQDIPLKLIEDIGKFCRSFPTSDDLESHLRKEIFKQRNVEMEYNLTRSFGS